MEPQNRISSLLIIKLLHEPWFLKHWRYVMLIFYKSVSLSTTVSVMSLIKHSFKFLTTLYQPSVSELLISPVTALIIKIKPLALLTRLLFTNSLTIPVSRCWRWRTCLDAQYELTGPSQNSAMGVIKGVGNTTDIDKLRDIFCSTVLIVSTNHSQLISHTSFSTSIQQVITH